MHNKNNTTTTTTMDSNKASSSTGGSSSSRWERKEGSFKSDATLEELRLSRRISDGGSVHIGESTRALNFSEQRRRSFAVPEEDDDEGGEDKKKKKKDNVKTTNATSQLSSSSSSLSSPSASSKAALTKTKKKKKIHERHSETYITCLMEDMRYALRELGADSDVIEHSQLESWTILVHECLSSNTRNFHSVHHVFEICAACDPVQLLAAAFRDTVNLRTDDNGHGDILSKRKQLHGIVVQQTSSEMILMEPKPDDTTLHLVLDIFDIKPGKNLSSWKGLNMFLSSVLFVRTFESTLSLKVLAQVVVAIEATIPFRLRYRCIVDDNGVDDDEEQDNNENNTTSTTSTTTTTTTTSPNNKSPLDHLYECLCFVNTKYDLKLDHDECIISVQRAADLANRNLGNFASSDATIFLDHTWSLLPEQSVALRQSLLYTVLDFLYATKDMTDFLHNLTPHIIFQSFHGVPSPEEMESFSLQTNENLRKGLIYLHANLVSVAVLGSFVILTGGDGPMSYFAGDLPTRGGGSNHTRTYRLAEGFCDGHLEDDSGLDYDEDVYDILVNGRSMDQSFDTRNSPLAAYVYCKLGDDGLKSAVTFVTCPMTEKSARNLLKSLPTEMLHKIGNEIGELAISRAQRIDELLRELC